MKSKKLHSKLFLLTITLYISFKSVASEDNSIPDVTNTCLTYCGNITVEYPFGLSSGCGHSGFRDLLYCINGMLMLHIPSGTYRVLNIDYAYNSITLHDSSMSDCYSLTLFSASSTSNGFVVEGWRSSYLSPAPDNVFMLLGCHADSPLFQGFPGKNLPCRNVSGMGCDEYYQCPAWGYSRFTSRKADSAYGTVTPPDCCSMAFGAIHSINLTHLKCQGYSSAYSIAPLKMPGPGAWSYGIRAKYSLPVDHDDECRACEATGGFCGYDLETNTHVCICPGFNTTSTCDSVSSAPMIKQNSSMMSLSGRDGTTWQLGRAAARPTKKKNYTKKPPLIKKTLKNYRKLHDCAPASGKLRRALQPQASSTTALAPDSGLQTHRAPLAPDPSIW